MLVIWMSGISSHRIQLLDDVPAHRRLSQEFVEVDQSRRDGNTDAGTRDGALNRQGYERLLFCGSLQLFHQTWPIHGSAEQLSFK